MVKSNKKVKRKNKDNVQNNSKKKHSVDNLYKLKFSEIYYSRKYFLDDYINYLFENQKDHLKHLYINKKFSILAFILCYLLIVALTICLFLLRYEFFNYFELLLIPLFIILVWYCDFYLKKRTFSNCIQERFAIMKSLDELHISLDCVPVLIDSLNMRMKNDSIIGKAFRTVGFAVLTTFSSAILGNIKLIKNKIIEILNSESILSNLFGNKDLFINNPEYIYFILLCGAFMLLVCGIIILLWDQSFSSKYQYRLTHTIRMLNDFRLNSCLYQSTRPDITKNSIEN